MALTSTVYNFDISLADVDRGVYETLALRVALHPSESLEFMLTRVLAYCLEYEEGIAFSKGGISEGDQPALWVTTPDGRVKTWIEVGLPDPERLNRASKSAGRVVIYTHRDPATIRRQAAGKRIHRAGEIEIHALDRRFLAELEPKIDRRTSFDLSVTGRQMYLTLGNESFSGAVTEHRLDST
ncbi:MAG TPA: YaeQ family protein [Thermoanaerobaculia bacterium]